MKNKFIAALLSMMSLSLTHQAMALTPEESVKEIASHLDALHPITWRSPAEKSHLVVFIDNQCRYCSDVVKNVQQYTNAGLTMSFLTVAPASIHDEVISDMARVWCSDFPQESLRKAMAGFLPDNDSTAACTKIVEEQSELAQRVGIQVTPVMVVMQPSSVVFVGSVKPEDILKTLKN